MDADPRLVEVSDVRQATTKGSRIGVATAFVCFGIGFALPVLGLLFIVIHSAVPGDTVFDKIGTILMIAAIPVLLLSSHLMDKLDRDV